MKRRSIAVMLTFILLVMLCGLHICSGEDCLICAQIEEMRIHGSYASDSILLFSLLLSVLLFGCCADNQGLRFRHTLFDLKVELNR